MRAIAKRRPTAPNPQRAQPRSTRTRTVFPLHPLGQLPLKLLESRMILLLQDHLAESASFRASLDHERTHSIKERLLGFRRILFIPILAALLCLQVRSEGFQRPRMGRIEICTVASDQSGVPPQKARRNLLEKRYPQLHTFHQCLPLTRRGTPIRLQQTPQLLWVHKRVVRLTDSFPLIQKFRVVRRRR